MILPEFCVFSILPSFTSPAIPPTELRPVIAFSFTESLIVEPVVTLPTIPPTIPEFFALISALFCTLTISFLL